MLTLGIGIGGRGTNWYMLLWASSSSSEDVDRFLWPFVARSRGRWVRLYTGRKELDHTSLEVFCCYQRAEAKCIFGGQFKRKYVRQTFEVYFRILENLLRTCSKLV